MKWKPLQLLTLVAITVWGAVIFIPDDKLHVIFCDVGQGDATLITYKTKQILVDSGPNARVLDCLNNHMPFYDRQIEMVITTHAQSDHQGGISYVMDRYTVLQFEPVLQSGDVVRLGPVVMKTISPKTSVLGMSTIGDGNEEGIVNLVSWNNFSLLLTADASNKAYSEVGKVTVLKVPHHGSKFALEKTWVEKNKPQLAIISVGKNNYGHPAPEIIEMLGKFDIHYARTDRDGEIEIVTDGNNFSVKK